VTIDQPRAPAIDDPGTGAAPATRARVPSEATPLSQRSTREARLRAALRVRPLAARTGATARTGQAIVEFALVLPIMMALLLAILEAGSFGARWIGYAHLADTIAASAATTGELPAWWTVEADRARCMDAAAVIIPASSSPARLELRCAYDGIAVNGLRWSVTIAETIPAS
jgi:hypothetical protein